MTAKRREEIAQELADRRANRGIGNPIPELTTMSSHDLQRVMQRTRSIESGHLQGVAAGLPCAEGNSGTPSETPSSGLTAILHWDDEYGQNYTAPREPRDEAFEAGSGRQVSDIVLGILVVIGIAIFIWAASQGVQ